MTSMQWINPRRAALLPLAVIPLLALVVTLHSVTALATADEPSARAGMVITNGKLFLSDNAQATALVIRGGRIEYVGNDRDALAQLKPGMKKLDAAGASVTPGLGDAHVHFLSGSLSLSQVDLASAESIEDIRALIESFAVQHRDHPVIMGRGWVYGSFPGGLPDKQLLDQLVPDRPAIMRCYDGHTVWVNSKALAAAGITSSTQDPVGGVIVRDAVTGQPTGVLKEAAQSLIDKVIPEATRQQKLDALKQGIAQAHRFGVTSVCEAGVGLAELDLFESLRSSNDLKLRMAIALEGRPRMIDSDFDALDSLKRRFDKLHIGAVKLYADGVIESHTAALLAPYANRPESRGLPETTKEDLARIITELDRRGWQIMVHAIGDGGIRMTLDAFEAAIGANSQRAGERRHRLEHIESISAQDIPRLNPLGVIASMQPYHANPNSNIFNVWAVNLGPERASRAWAWHQLQSAGARLAFGSDWPVVAIDPRLGIHTALTRQTLDGQPAEGFLPGERLPLKDVLAAYTQGAAFAQFDEQRRGRLAVGLDADIVIWDRDLFSVSPGEVHKAQVTKTIFNGEVVYAQ